MLLPLANNISPLVFTSVTQLLFANWFIGLVEAVVISLLFCRGRQPPLKLGRWCVAANYASWLGGTVVMSVLFSSNQLNAALAFSVPWLVIPLLIGGTFAVSTVIELPFLRAAGLTDLRTAVKACVVSNLVSHVLLLGLFALSTRVSLLTDWTQCPAAEAPEIVGTRVFFLDPSGTPTELPLSPGATQRAFAPPMSPNAWFIRYDDGDTGTLELPGREPLVVHRATHRLGKRSYPDDEIDLRKSPGTYNPMRIWVGGVRFDRTSEAGTTTIDNDAMLMTPFFSLRASHITVLDGDLTIAEFGGRITLFDPHHDRFYLLARGSAPIVVTPVPGGTPPPTTAPSSRRSP